MSYSPPSDSRSPWADQAQSAPPPKSGRPLAVILLIVGAVILVPCVCCGGMTLIMGRGIYLAIAERDNIQAGIHQYMQHMSAKRGPPAYLELSARGQRLTSMEQHQQLVDGPEHAKYSGYRSTFLTNVKVSIVANSNPDVPQGTVANVQGTFIYDGGVTGSFQATLEREGNTWHIYRIDITVPPSKMAEPGAK